MLEIQLSGKYGDGPKDYLAGEGKGKYSVADIKTWPWVKNWERSGKCNPGIESSNEIANSFAGFTKEEFEAYPHLLKWIDRIAERPAVQRGIGETYALKK